MILEIHPQHPEPRKIRRAVEKLEAGEVIAYPTDTVYGLGCDSMNKKAVERLYSLKHMDKAHPVAWVCPGLSDIARYAIVENRDYRVLRHFLPGPYCFILKATRDVPKMLQSKRKTVGIRIPNHPVPVALARELGRPILSSTAARDDGEVLIDPHEIDELFRGLGLVLDGGTGGMIPSTVVDLSGEIPEIIREGAGPIDELVE